MIPLIHAASSQFQPSFRILGQYYIYIYPDFNASIAIVVIVEVVVSLLTGGGVCLGGQNWPMSHIKRHKYQFAIKLITVSLAGIIRSSSEIELVYKFDCKLIPVTWGHHERIHLGPDFSHALHWIYQYMLGCSIHMYFIVPRRLHAYKDMFKTVYGNWLPLICLGHLRLRPNAIMH